MIGADLKINGVVIGKVLSVRPMALGVEPELKIDGRPIAVYTVEPSEHLYVGGVFEFTCKAVPVLNEEDNGRDSEDA